MFAAVTSTNADHVRAAIVAWRGIQPRATTRHPSACAGYLSSPALDCDVTEGADGFAIGKIRIEPLPGNDVATQQVLRETTRLEQCRQLILRDGVSGLRRLDGVYGVVVWNDHANELLVARDPLGLCPLFYRQDDTGVMVSDCLAAFPGPSAFDSDYIAHFIAGRGRPNTALTIRAGVRAVEPGTWMRWTDGRLTRGQFWSPLRFQPLKIGREEAVEEFRRLLTASLALHVDPADTTWSHLSGGLDSSSIVCFAEHQAPARDRVRIGGTLTFHNALGVGNDDKYVRIVLNRYPLRNVTLADLWPWSTDDLGPPETDRPSRDYPFYKRDRLAAARVTAAGGTALLSGIGPDYYLPDTSKQCPDLLWSLRLRECIQELRTWAAANRGSFWQVALTDGLLPLLWNRAPAWFERGLSTVSGWFQPKFRKVYEIRGLLMSRNGIRDARRGQHYAHQVGSMLNASAEGLSVWRFSPGLDMRHPFLHKPLVELCLQLPLHLRTDVHWPKPILRSAMKGILPDEVRLRAGGSLLAPIIQWAFRREQPQLVRLLRHSILADLGCIEPRHVENALKSFEVYRSGAASFLYALLALETWLSAKTGRWSHNTWQ
jgi:asparagine synthase (glutamine-hydrolysing)